MGRYLNAYQILSDVREGINEFSTALLQATDTTGALSNSVLMRYINESQRFLFNLSFVRGPEDYLTSTSLTPVASAITLPSNFYKIARLEFADGAKVYKMQNLDQKHQGNAMGAKYLYRKQGRNTLYIDQDNVTDPVTLWYYARPRDLHMGQAQSGSGASALKMLAANCVALDDYYNGMIVEDITAGFASTITDFVASTLVATVTGTASANDWYGLVPEAPEPFHHLIVSKAILLAKSDVKSPVQASPKEVAEFQELLGQTFGAYYGTASEDVSMEEIFLDFGAYY